MTVEEVDRICAMQDPAARNLRITGCYHAISQAFERLTGGRASWCTFATWASKQAGMTIRREDLARAFERHLRLSPELAAVLPPLAALLARHGLHPDAQRLLDAVRQAADPDAAFRRAADAVARGNLKVFAEIGREFARFLTELGADEAPDEPKLARFCETLRPGEPPEGQRLLREAFTAYGRARFEPEPKLRAERLLLANLLVGFHEQTRLQPEIREALDAALGDPARIRRRLLERLLPGFWVRARVRLARLLGRELPLDRALDRIAREAGRLLRRTLTDHMMTLHLPGETLLLGRDLSAAFPEPLRRLTHPELRALLDRIDPTPDDVRGSGTDDWADFPDRMHFIADLFRAYQEHPALLEPPFPRESGIGDRAPGDEPPIPDS